MNDVINNMNSIIYINILLIKIINDKKFIKKINIIFVF